MWWRTRRNKVSSFGETDESIWIGRGRQFSRLMAAGVCASAVVMLDTPCSEVVWMVLATHYIRQFPLHFPSRASPCAITFQLDSTCTALSLRQPLDITLYLKTKLPCSITKRPSVYWKPTSRTIYPQHNKYQLLYIYSIPPDDGLQICPKHVGVEELTDEIN